jgi:hypothetical protein
VSGWLVAISMVAVPAIAAGPDGQPDPCKNLRPRRIAIVFARSSGLLGGDGCKGAVYPSRKVVCEGDTVQWSVINACDAEEVTDIRLEGLARVAEKCTVVRRLGLAGTSEIRCRLKRLPENTRQEYEVTARIGRSRLIVDPELEIRRPR